MEKIKLSESTLNLLQEFNEARCKIAELEKQVSKALSDDTDNMLRMCYVVGGHAAQLYHNKGKYSNVKNLLCDLTDETLVVTADSNDCTHFDLKIDGIKYCIVVHKPTSK